MTAKLYDLNQQQRQQIVFLKNKSDNLEGTVRRETWTPSTMSEIEVLRRRVVEMDGKDDEFIRMRDQCLELERRLNVETENCSSLKEEVEKLNGRIDDLDRIERALGKSKKECSLLKSSLEKERDANKILSGEIDTMKTRVRELEQAEGQLERSEAAVKNDLAKLRSLTVALVEERKAMAEKLQLADEKLNRKESKKAEQGNLTAMTEKFKDERQQVLRSKAELEKRMLVIGQEKDELEGRLTTAEDRNVELQNKITLMKKRMQVLENRKEKGDNFQVNYNHHCQTEENRVKQLTHELDQLQKRLQDKEMLDRELMKVEEDFQSLERRFKDEQTKCRALTKELEVAKKELSRYQQAEKHEVNQEHLLLCCLQKEQVKSRLLERELNALKEKLQKLVGTEESITKVQTDHSTLQDKLVQQEARNKELAREKKELSSELNRIRQTKTESYRELDSELHQSSKEIQTEPEDGQYSEYTTQGFVLNEEIKVDPNHNVEVSNRYLAKNINSLDNVNNGPCQGNALNAQPPVNGEVMMLTHSPGQPLHIKVTPHHTHNSATLEISSPTTDTATSFTSKAVIPTAGTPPKQRITIIQNSTLPVLNSKSPISSPDSSLNGTPISRMLSPNLSRSVTPDHNNSPIQILTVRTCSPDPSDITNPAAFSKSPEPKSHWPHLKSSCGDPSPNVITTEDSKIHIHLGSPYLQPHGIPPSAGPYYLRHEQTTQVLANGCHVKGVGKITSSITISPSTSPTSLSANSRWPM
ncbi:filamin A-interacting protein 1-like [Synchiropus picturatus]